jgi:hypothetical protein
MNKKVIVIFLLTISALVVLYLYSFGPLSYKRTAGQVNPSSLKPATAGNVTINNKSLSLSSYHNRDKKENYYAVKFPQDWQVKTGDKPGGYSLNFNGSAGTVELMDVPDNTTLELYVLSQEEPRLKKATTDYSRVGYQKTTVNGAEAYQLIYRSKQGQDDFQTLRTYITGQDESGVMTLSAKQSDFDSLKPLFSSVVDSFQWENK